MTYEIFPLPYDAFASARTRARWEKELDKLGLAAVYDQLASMRADPGAAFQLNVVSLPNPTRWTVIRWCAAKEKKGAVSLRYFLYDRSRYLRRRVVALYMRAHPHNEN